MTMQKTGKQTLLDTLGQMSAPELRRVLGAQCHRCGFLPASHLAVFYLRSVVNKRPSERGRIDGWR